MFRWRSTLMTRLCVMQKDFDELLGVIAKLDHLKSTMRDSATLDGSKKENSAEHSWQCAIMALLFQRFLDVPVDLEKVLTMLVIHDTGEIDAGDIGLYESYDAGQQYERELNCVRTLFANSHPELVETWKEFEEGVTVEAKYARAIDRIAGMLSSHFNERSCWSEEGMSAEQILSRNLPIKAGLPMVWPMVEGLVRQADAAGRIGTEGITNRESQ